MPRRIGLPALAGLAAAVAAAALVAAALYGTALRPGNGGTCPDSTAALGRVAPLARGEVAAFRAGPRAVPAEAFTFQGPDGRRLAVADLRGRTVLLNLWATWCEPCKREMPALDRLQADLGGPTFEVVAVNLDTRDLDRPRRWLEQAGIRNLAYYADPEAKLFQEVRRAGLSEGLPTSLLIGPDGCRIGLLAGWAEWASPDGVALIRAASGREAADASSGSEHRLPR